MNSQTSGTLIVLALVIAFLIVGTHFGWISQAPPLLAPGIQ